MKKWNEFCINNHCSDYEGKTERACSAVPSSSKGYLMSVEMAVFAMFKQNFLKG
jgi:hypothetical protein